MSGMTVSEAVASRRTVRGFRDTPVPEATLRRVLDKARMSPSGCNFQPWEATVLAGAPLRALQERMRGSAFQAPPEYAIQPADAPPHLHQRLAGIMGRMYGAAGIARDDAARRDAMLASNLASFGAPALLLCYTPRYMGPPQWQDIGMWLQTVMLLLREEGLDSAAQQFLTVHARVIKDAIGVDDATHIFVCGLAIGYRDPDDPVNGFERLREPLDDHVRFAGFDEAPAPAA